MGRYVVIKTNAAGREQNDWVFKDIEEARQYAANRGAPESAVNDDEQLPYWCAFPHNAAERQAAQQVAELHAFDTKKAGNALAEHFDKIGSVESAADVRFWVERL